VVIIVIYILYFFITSHCSYAAAKYRKFNENSLSSFHMGKNSPNTPFSGCLPSLFIYPIWDNVSTETIIFRELENISIYNSRDIYISITKIFS
jgi:hypothetical protein